MYRKTDLHLHLDGSVRPTTAWEIIKEQGLTLPDCNTLEECHRRMIVGEDSDSLLSYFRAFEIPGAVLRTERALERVTEELIETLDQDGVGYAEIRFAPQIHGPLSQKQAVEAVLRGCDRGQGRFPKVRVGVILCAMSYGDPTKNQKENEETLALCADMPDKLAFDLAGEEIPLEGFEPLFREAGRRGVPFTIHAGEALGPENVRFALDLGARRIGHGIAAARDKDLMERLAAEGIVLEVSLTSNVQTRSATSYETHPIRELYDAGVAVTVCTDNRTCSETSLKREYGLLKQYLGFTDAELRKTNANGFRAAFFLTEEEKKAFITALENDL